MSPRPVYFDCDTGIDDALALAYLMASPEIQLVGIGTVSGNINARQAAVNTLDLLAMGGMHDVAVAVGAMDPLARPFSGGVPHIHGYNGVGDIELPHTDKQPEAESAHEMLVRLANEYPGSSRSSPSVHSPTWPWPSNLTPRSPTRFVRSRSWEGRR